MPKKSKNIIISNPKRLAKLVAAFKRGGAAKIHVLADFDRTLTKAFVNGEKTPSLISVLRRENLLTPEYSAKAFALYHKYGPLEHDPRLSLKEKKRLMRQWWLTHFKLLIKTGLNKKDIAKAVNSENMRFRGGAPRFFKFLYGHKIPLVILSAGGLGQESILMFLKKRAKLYGNIQIISNSFIWDKNGRAIGFNEPIIHTANKDETEIKNFPAVMKKIKNKTNVILLGDLTEDLNMITGFNYDNLIKIGFLNENIKTNLPIFKKRFDVILFNDAPMDFINKLLTVIASERSERSNLTYENIHK